MPRSYVVTVPGKDAETISNPSKAADLLIGNEKKRHKGELVSQLANLKPGDTLHLNNRGMVECIGVAGDDEVEPEVPVEAPVPPEEPEVPVVPPPTEDKEGT